MTQAEVGTVQGFLGTPSPCRPTQSGVWQLRGKEGVDRKGKLAFQEIPLTEAAPEPLRLEGLKSPQASWGALRGAEACVLGELPQLPGAAGH